MTTASLVEGVKRRDQRALSRAISIVESAGAECEELIDRVAGELTHAGFRVGVTGPPGVGKSSLTGELIKAARARGETVGVLAVDPTSPVTGGALLGDRLRMEAALDDAGVYFRSMATRGHVGGLASATADAADLLDLSGVDRALIETVGVGQAETEVMGVVDLVVLVLAPGLGDQLQALKAGILEIAQLIVVNKSDLGGAERVVADIEDAQSLRREGMARAPVISTSVTGGAGLRELNLTLEQAIAARLHAADRDEQLVTRRAQRVLRILKEHVDERWFRDSKLVDDLRARHRRAAAVPPYATARETFARLLSGGLGKVW
ncbi:MAG: methylmalonyl Co-A mutase-associated GTPase MeaB [Planctomycetota bacterium]